MIWYTETDTQKAYELFITLKMKHFDRVRVGGGCFYCLPDVELMIFVKLIFYAKVYYYLTV